MQVVAVELGIPTVDDEARRATAAATSLLAPLDAQLGPVDLKLVQSLKDTLTEQTDRTIATVGEIVQQGLTLGPNVDASLDLATTLTWVSHFNQPSLSDVYHVILHHSLFISYGG